MCELGAGAADVPAGRVRRSSSAAGLLSPPADPARSASLDRRVRPQAPARWASLRDGSAARPPPVPAAPPPVPPHAPCLRRPPPPPAVDPAAYALPAAPSARPAAGSGATGGRPARPRGHARSCSATVPLGPLHQAASETGAGRPPRSESLGRRGGDSRSAGAPAGQPRPPPAPLRSVSVVLPPRSKAFMGVVRSAGSMRTLGKTGSAVEISVPRRTPRHFSTIDSAYTSQGGLADFSQLETSGGSVRIQHLTGGRPGGAAAAGEPHDSLIAPCAHFHYEHVHLPGLEVSAAVRPAWRSVRRSVRSGQ
ncbi:formin-like protein 20 [Amphibalanus amphitrite]|uniref:formin-like protein 20 n=1 Tax=Amphibalanus amphitrite TaxID=1232801 RepID=UPI001C914797|nr:formin-like protein 20 [Amphibalanus amphitrite]